MLNSRFIALSLIIVALIEPTIAVGAGNPTMGAAVAPPPSTNNNANGTSMGTSTGLPTGSVNGSANGSPMGSSTGLPPSSVNSGARGSSMGNSTGLPTGSLNNSGTNEEDTTSGNVNNNTSVGTQGDVGVNLGSTVPGADTNLS